ncbi:MAG: Ti-type conjugative transfer relaxase TraA, partial [Gammaproteobacteria bacterium]|nr:Ti-type conjugative transfer relaxase TraA [Gammaproteobacteria bacterium]
ALDPDDDKRGRFTSRDMVEAENSLIRRTASMAERHRHGVPSDTQNTVLTRFPMSDPQRRAFEWLVGEGDIKAIAVTKDLKDTLLSAARHAWDSESLAVKGAALSEQAAQHLEAASGIDSQSIAQCEEQWQQGAGLPDAGTVLLLDGAQTMGLKQLERILAVADKARAKLVLVADFDQLRAMRVDTPFRTVLSQLENLHEN